MEVDDKPVTAICWREDNKLVYLIQENGNSVQKEMAAADLAKVKLDMKKFKTVAKDFSLGELPVLDEVDASEYAAMKFPDKYQFVRVSNEGEKIQSKIDLKKFITLQKAGEGFDWLWKAVKRNDDMIVYVTNSTWRNYFPVTLIARKYKDNGSTNRRRYQVYYKTKDGGNMITYLEEDNIYVPKDSVDEEDESEDNDDEYPGLVEECVSFPLKKQKQPTQPLQVATSFFGKTAEQKNIFKILFLYGLKHEYMEVNEKPIASICWKNETLFYKMEETDEEPKEMTDADLAKIKLDMVMFRKVSDDFLNKNELPLIKNEYKSQFSAIKFPTKLRFIELKEPQEPVLESKNKLKKDFIALDKAKKDMKWLWETAKEMGDKLEIYLGDNKVIPIAQLGLTYKDEEGDNITNESLYFRAQDADDGTFFELVYQEEDLSFGGAQYEQGPSLKTIYVPKSLIKRGNAGMLPNDIKTESLGVGEGDIAEVDFAAPPAPRFVMQYEEGVTPAIYLARIPERHEL